MIDNIRYVPHFIHDSDVLWSHLMQTVEWNTQMSARYTASFGVPYQYAQMKYPAAPMPDNLNEIIHQIEEVNGFTPNNCLINYYLDGQSSMGYHADDVLQLAAETGITIISLGASRDIVFRMTTEPQTKVRYLLENGSFFYMNQATQLAWQHAIPPSKTTQARMSLTFRRLRE